MFWAGTFPRAAIQTARPFIDFVGDYITAASAPPQAHDNFPRRKQGLSNATLLHLRVRCA